MVKSAKKDRKEAAIKFAQFFVTEKEAIKIGQGSKFALDQIKGLIMPDIYSLIDDNYGIPGFAKMIFEND